MLKKIFIAFLLSIFAWSNSFADKRPNVIVILADDLGVGDVSNYRRMHTNQIILETPNIDKLANSGMKFTNAHAPAALCATSRYAIMTGNSCYRSTLPWGVWGGYSKSVIKPDQLTLGRLMKQADYQTAFLGKWHLGTTFNRKDNPNVEYVPNKKKKIEDEVDITRIVASGPNQNGFDYSFNLPSGIQNVPYAAYENDKWFPLTKESKIAIIDQEYMASLDLELDKKEGLGDSNWEPRKIGPLLVNKAVDYIKGHANKKEPFFMYYCSQAVHTPHSAAKELNGVKIAGTTPSRHMDMIKELDVQVGMIVDELKEQGIYENTVLIFTSDNGGLHVDGDTWNSHHEPSDIYRGCKNDPYEGGHRVPFIVTWPKEIKAKQSTEQPILGLDIMATLAAITDQNISADVAMDSYNLLPVLQNTKGAKTHPFLMVQGGSHKEVIIIDEGWKLIIQMDKKDKTDKIRTPIALFDLNNNEKEDERYNLINDKKYQDKIEYLFKKYNDTRDNKPFTGKHL
ncbi:sulfatase family protein [Labilibaculum antarcticum]|uniref:Sulfatase n=1 Tax=Labilibaculum antarcticum TaxID=1717717 RepID=A0A1Y1CLF1_9BACT|nr:arylsulfatase [Labilibaculum antarcticum]BAX81124.1 sulfatase [Labilibaculum antarcticum]